MTRGGHHVGLSGARIGVPTRQRVRREAIPDVIKTPGALKGSTVRTGVRTLAPDESRRTAQTPVLIRIEVDRLHAEMMCVVAALAVRRRGQGRNPGQIVMIVVRVAGSRTPRVARQIDPGCGNLSCLMR